MLAGGYYMYRGARVSSVRDEKSGRTSLERERRPARGNRTVRLGKRVRSLKRTASERGRVLIVVAISSVARASAVASTLPYE